MEELNRERLLLKRLEERKSKTSVESLINPSSKPEGILEQTMSKLERITLEMQNARKSSAPIIFAFGAHLIKNGLSKIFIELMEMGYVQHVLGNGAVAIHDWELAYHGKTEEDVRENLSHGQFGLWDETGKYLNLAISIGNKEGLGYGESVGRMISQGKIYEISIPHLHKDISILGKSYELNIPVSISESIGENIHHMHPSCDGAAIGASSYRDFLRFAKTIERLQDGVYISIGSGVKSPMVFEKALSMAKNIARQEGKKLDSYNIFVIDIQPCSWDWKSGEPSKKDPSYYHRFFKSFSRAGGRAEYIELDNRLFLHNLYHILKK